jgi:hypothetical protein
MQKGLSIFQATKISATPLVNVALVLGEHPYTLRLFGLLRITQATSR